MCKSCRRRGRVVKDRRTRPARREESLLGASGITLIEYLPKDAEEPTTFKVSVGDVTASYQFGPYRGDRIRFVDSSHARQLLEIKDAHGEPLFAIVAEYGGARAKKQDDNDASIMRIVKRGVNITQESDGDLPSGFALRGLG